MARKTWPESVDHALCYGWIDGLRTSIDDARHMIRFTPRQSASTWSAVNIKRIERLTERGLMQPSGLAAYNARHASRSGTYSYEQRPSQLPEPYKKIFATNALASSSRHLVGHERKEGGDAPATARAVDHRLITWRTAKAIFAVKLNG